MVLFIDTFLKDYMLLKEILEKHPSVCVLIGFIFCIGFFLGALMMQVMVK